MLQEVKERGFNIILHPDVIKDFKNWKSFGEHLCIENMDKRKLVGRTSNDLEEIFYNLPNARFCMDLAHARQVDPSMTESFLMLKKFGNRLAQIHLSDINNRSIHEPLNFESILCYRKLSFLINPETPIILKSPVTANKIESEIQLVSLIFDEKKFNNLLHSLTENNVTISVPRS